MSMKWEDGQEAFSNLVSGTQRESNQSELLQFLPNSLNQIFSIWRLSSSQAVRNGLNGTLIFHKITVFTTPVTTPVGCPPNGTSFPLWAHCPGFICPLASSNGSGWPSPWFSRAYPPFPLPHAHCTPANVFSCHHNASGSQKHCFKFYIPEPYFTCLN